MNQRGFATILGLCLILAIALTIRGIHEAEMNHAYEAANFRAEFYLQNVADNALIEAAGDVINDPNKIPLDKTAYLYRRPDHQVLIATMPPKSSEHLQDVTVEVWGERIALQSYKVSYKTDAENASSAGRNTARKAGTPWAGYVFFSVAAAKIPHTGETIYRRAYAYVPIGGKTIHFMEVPMSRYTFK